MNAERLLAHFETISEAPDAIARLRRFILDLAVRGKLVEQDPEDEPVAGYLKLLNAKPAERGDFSIPRQWAWVSVGEVSTSRLGKMLDKAKNKGTERPYLRNINVRWLDFDLSDLLEMRFEDSELSEYELESGDVLICEGGEPGRAAVWDGRARDIYFQKAIHRVRLDECVDPLFFVYALRCSAQDERLSRYFTGTGISHFTGKSLKAYLFPLPPLAEQHRIVAKVDELMALCDQLEAARQERERGRERLVAATLQRLNEPDEDPASFRHDARFALQVLPSLASTAAQIKQLRQTILNLAVRGKLVEQDPEDEPAICWLMERMDESSSSRHEKSKSLPYEGSDVDAESMLPDTWLWVVLGDLASSMDSGWSPQCEDHPRSSIVSWGVLKTTAVQSLAFDESHHKELPLGLQPKPQYETRVGDVLVTRAGPKNRVGICCVVESIQPCLMISDKLIRMRFASGLSSKFIAMALNAGRSRDALEDAKSGMAVMQMNISQSKLRSIPIPLPPLAEQHRIVAKVDTLMALCDQLEQQLNQADQQRRRLLEAVLAEALREPERALAALPS